MLHRFIERFERRFAPKTEIVSVSVDAIKTLHYFGFTHSQIVELQKLVKEFDGAYTNCLKKIEAMKVLQKSRWAVIVPHFNEGDELPVGGSCREITDSMLRRLAQSGLLEEVNRKSKEKVKSKIVKGTNITHFQNSSHVWCGLVRESRPEEMIVIDASYQEITHLRSNGHKVWRMDDFSDVKKVTQSELSMSSVYIGNDSIEVYDVSDRILGLSADKSICFSLGFCTQNQKSLSEDNNNVIPFIRIGGINLQDDAIFLINPYSNKINSEFKNAPFKITDSARVELQELLNAASTIKYVAMNSKS